MDEPNPIKGRPGLITFNQRIRAAFSKLVFGLTCISGAALLVMMLVTCADVVGRLFNRPITGAFDIVRIAGAITVACAIPYTTAIKGHVAIEYFFHKFGRGGRIVIDTVMRIMVIALFAALTWQSAQYGNALRAVGQVSSTLEIPLFWIPHLIAFCCAVTVGVTFSNLLHPGKEMIKP